MAKKSRLDKDAFDWVQDTSETADSGGKEKKQTATQRPRKRPPLSRASMLSKSNLITTSSESSAQRSVFVRYDNSSGEIISLTEITKGQGASEDHLQMFVPGGQTVKEISLTGNLASMLLLDIHLNYQVQNSQLVSKL